MKVILDTDIGSDIDDAVCLAYLLAQPKCELLGITTVTGEPVERAKLADAVCRAGGRDIPILPGLEHPMLVPIRQSKASQAAALPKWPHRTEYPMGQAIDFLRQTIRRHPGEVTLLTIGPLTNIATLFLLDPEIPGMLKSLVMMGGNFTPIRWVHAGHIPAEWNILNDPHAAAIVFRAPVPNLRAIGLDVTTKVTMSAEQVRQRFQHKLLKPVLDFSDVWFRGAKEITFHDPLAAATMFDDQICTFESGTVDVEYVSDKLSGFTYWNTKDKTPRHEVATSVNGERFFDHYFGQFK